MIRVDEGALVYFREPRELGEQGLSWATFARLGGVSAGPFASLNVGYHVGDDSQSVTANRSVIAHTLSSPRERVLGAQQVHGDKVLVVDESHLGIGSASWEDAFPETDALVTRARRMFLLITVADCVALTFFDPAKQAVGIAHCGWKGMIARLGQKTIDAMQTEFGSRPGDLALIVSPSIGPCCYEVGELVLAPLQLEFPAWQGMIRQFGTKVHLDLWEMARQQALESGVKAESIHVAGLCTACHTELFFSHRAERGRTGRFAVVAGLR